MKAHLGVSKALFHGLLAAALCAGCGPADSSSENDDGHFAAVDETTPASAATRQSLGVSAWHYRVQQDGSAAIEGRDDRGGVKVALHAIPGEDGDASYTQIDGGGVERPPDEAVVAAFRADVADPQRAESEREIGGSDAIERSEFDFAAALGREELAGAEPSSAAPGVEPQALTEAQRKSRREALKCLQRFANQAYTVNNALLKPDCNLKPTPWNSTDVMKVFDGASKDIEAVVIAFAGTHDLGDFLQDLKSLKPVMHSNPLNPALPQLGSVGKGWDVRWHNQASAHFKQMLEWYRNDARTHNRRLGIIVTGHSLGGVTATLAGYDIAQYLRGNATPWSVYVTAFNPPRLGLSGARDKYQDALFASRCPAAGNDICLTLWQMTRAQDPFHTYPPGMSHAVWQTAWGNPTVGPGPHQGQNLGYCPQLHTASLFKPWAPLASHRLGSWAAQIDQVAGYQIDCMFEHRD
jgi:hypothetical protein